MMLDARMITAKEEDFANTNKEICDRLMQGKEYITLHDFKELRQELKIALRHFEFY
jgi:hypothetical protein